MKKKDIKNIIISFVVIVLVAGVVEEIGKTKIGKALSEVLTMKDTDDEIDTKEMEGDEREYLPGETEDTINFQYSTDKTENETIESFDPFDPTGYYESSNTSNEVSIEPYENDLISSKFTENKYIIYVYDSIGNLQSQMLVEWDHELGLYYGGDGEDVIFVLSESAVSRGEYVLTANDTTMYLNTYDYDKNNDRSLTGFEDLGGGYNGYRDYDGQDMFISITRGSDAYADEGQYIVSVYDSDDNEFVYVIRWDDDLQMYICNDRVYLCNSDDPYYNYMIVDNGVRIYLEER